jgi:hypothetical protein
MNPRLVLHLDVDPKIGKERSSTPDGHIFSFPGQIIRLKIEDIVILHSSTGGVAGHTVPGAWKRQPAVRKHSFNPRLGRRLRSSAFTGFAINPSINTCADGRIVPSIASRMVSLIEDGASQVTSIL